MNPPQHTLAPSLQDISEAISDFRYASFQSCESVLSRLVTSFEEEPLAGFLRAALPQVEFDAWLDKASGTVGSMVGSGVLEWPADRSSRVAMQIELCRSIVNKSVRFLDFVHEFMYTGNDLSAHIDNFAATLLEPMLRDITRLTESRPVPPVLFEAMGQLPPSGDATLDALLRDACMKFKDPAPKTRSEATEKLWDAWERLKSLEIEGNKRLSVARLLDQSSPEQAFRALLETEACALTTIGNAFHIRHFETDKVALERAEHNDYLFHRLFALIHLLLFSRARNQ
ncbi:MAG: hypothetical protein K2Q07_06360 [Burkholderiaceae bacterium]|nr:hypothetical protein [Burkholderiaceae bacterium]